MRGLFDGFSYIIAAEHRTLADNPLGIYVRPPNEHVTNLRRQRHLDSDIIWHGNILVAKVDSTTDTFTDLSGSDIPLVYNLLTRPKLDTKEELQKAVELSVSKESVPEHKRKVVIARNLQDNSSVQS